MVLGYVFMYVGGMCSHIAAFRILYHIRMVLSEHIGRLPLGYFNHNTIGKIKKNIEQDVEKIELFIAHQLPDLVSAIVMVFAIMIAMLYLNIGLALACIIPIVVGIFLQYSMMSGQKAKKGLTEYFDALENINSSSVQYVRGMSSIKMFGQTVRSFRKFHDDILRYRNFVLAYTDNFQNGYVSFKVIVLSLATFVTPIGLFFIHSNPDNIAIVSTWIFFLVLAPGISMPMFKLNTLASNLTVIIEGVRRIDEILAEKIIEEPEISVLPCHYNVQFREVSFSYDRQHHQQALKQISFTARQGEITALVGPSGSGKSTITQLLLRFWDVQQGGITIGGVNIREMSMNELMNTIAFVFQETFLFSDTIYNNIAVGKQHSTKEEVYAVAKAAQCHDFIEQLPLGYETIIGEGDVLLSGGEEQRISVARALLKNAPILVLDEATAYADPENEVHMQLALQELIKGKTVLIIAHRLTTICEAHQIIVLKEGEMEDSGSHQELLSRGGLYKNMWDALIMSTQWEMDHVQETVEVCAQ